ncbi:MAG: glycerophosphodiester phosphodiesterase [Ilumatobacteraceae bacterium]
MKIEHAKKSTALPSFSGVQQRLPSRLDPPLTFAHRGARAVAPENTIEAFQLALRLGASGLESDVWLTADGVPVLDHDGVVRGGLRKKPIAQVDRRSLPEHIPSLAELLDACGTDYALSLDVKDPAATMPIAEVVRDAADGLPERTWLCDPDVDRLVELRPELADVRLVNSIRLDRIKEGPERRAARLAQHGIDAMNMHRTDWNGGLVALFHRFDRYAFCWDLQHEHQLRDAFRMGVDAVYSDHVDVMQDAFASEIGGDGAGRSGDDHVESDLADGV